jgi:hypothetical protein
MYGKLNKKEKEYVLYNPYHNDLCVLKSGELKYWNEFDSAWVYIGEF